MSETGYFTVTGRKIGEPEPKSPEQLARDDFERQVLEAAARKLEAMNVNQVYRQALKKGAKEIRAMKP